MTDQSHQDMVRIPTRWPIVTFVTGVVLATGFYFDTRASSKDNAEKIMEQKIQIESIRSKQALQELDILSSRVHQDNILKLLSEMKQDIREIKLQRSPERSR